MSSTIESPPPVIHNPLGNREIGIIQRYAARVLDRHEEQFGFWLALQSGDSTTYRNFCQDCAQAEKERLARINPKAEYAIDGGWELITDEVLVCESCNALLRCNPSTKGLRLTLERMTHRPFSFEEGPDAYRLAKCLQKIWWHLPENPTEAVKADLIKQVQALHDFGREFIRQKIKHDAQRIQNGN